MIIQKYNPTLSDLLKIDSLPSNLGFIQTPLSSFLDNFFYQNLHSLKSRDGSSASYTLDIITYQALTLLEIPGTGIKFILNPADPSTNIQGSSLFNISLEYRWELLKYIANVNLQSFGFDIKSFLILFSNIFGISQHDVLKETINAFLGNIDNPPIGIDPLQLFVNNYNSNHVNQLTYTPPPNDSKYDNIYNQLVTFGEDIFELIVNNYLPNGFSDFQELLAPFIGPASQKDLIQLMTPQFSLAINDIGLGLTFPRSFLTPLDNSGNPIPEPAQSILYANAGSFLYDTQKGFLFNEMLSFSLTPSSILNTGFTLSITDAIISLSSSQVIPDLGVSAQSSTPLPPGFMGIYAQSIVIGLPQYLIPTSSPNNAQIVGTDILIGTGGITGTLTLDTTKGPVLQTNLGSGSGFSIGLNSFSLTFQQSAITASEIKGVLTIPGFTDVTGSNPAVINVDVHFGPDGSFDVTASASPPLVIKIPDVLNFNIATVEVGNNKAGKWFVALSGSIDFTATIPVLGSILPTGVTIKKLIVYEDGTFEFEGGGIVLPVSVTLNVGPVKISVSHLSFGSWENAAGRKYHFFGFDGGLNVNPGGIDVRANGVKLYFSDDSNPSRDIFLRIQGIAIDIIIPGDASPSTAAVLLHGFLTMANPTANTSPPQPSGTQYVGGVSVSIPSASISGTANMALNPSLPAFLIDMDLEISVPIPIVPGLGIYGFRGLIGSRYVADKSNPALGIPPDADWYQYYKLKLAPDYSEGIQAEKMEQEDGFSLGAGISFATTGDSGKAFSSKLFFLLSVPDVFLIQGQAAILRQRIGLDTTTDPPFSLFIAITNQYVQASIGASYQLPEDSGNIARINGEIDMSFPFQNNGWYINFGQDQPPSKRILVRLLNIFDAYFYLMISGQGIRAGAGASFSENLNFGPVGLYLSAYIDVAGRISFEPKQIGGSLDMGGSAGIKVFGFKLGLSLSASLAGESPMPFDVTGSVTVGIKLPWPLKNIGITVSFTWTFNASLNLSEVSLVDLTTLDAKQPARALNIMSSDTFSLFYATSASNPLPPIPATWGNDPGNGNLPLSSGGYTVPMDSFIDFEFLKGLLPLNGAVTNIGGVTSGANYVEQLGPQQAASPIVQHSFSMQDIKIYSWNPTAGQWNIYNIYAALTPQQDLLSIPPSAYNNLFSGFWQLGEPNNYNKMRVLAQTPFSYLIDQAGNPVTPEAMGIDTSTIGCAEAMIVPTCINFDGEAGGVATPPYQLIAGQVAYYENVLLQTASQNAVVVLHPGFSHTDALEIAPGDTLSIFFTQATAQACLSLSSASSVIIESFQKVPSGVNSSNLPVYIYNLVDTKVLNSSQLNNPICYQNIGLPIDKITITANPCKGQGSSTSNNEGLTCTDNTPQARQFLVFLNTLANPQNDDLTRANFNLYPQKNSVYNGVFQNTVLYTAPLSSTKTIKYKSSYTNNILTVSITDNNGFSCGFTLQGLTPTEVIDFTTIVSFSNLRLNPNDLFPGNNYDFLVDAITSTGVTITLQGTSCYPIASCVYNCGTFLYQVCSLTLVDALFNQSIPSQAAVTGNNATMAEAVNNTLQPIWRPNTIYAIQVTTQDQVSAPGNATINNLNYLTVGFQTAGPVGFFQQSRTEYQALVAQGLGDQYRLADLKDYIDYTKSYPNADGNILSSKPLFYQNPQLLLFYVENYVYAMFGDWAPYNGLPALTGNMQVTIKDPAESAPPPVLTLSISNNWKTNSTPTISKDVSIMNNMLQNGNPCSGVAPMVPMGVNTAIDLTNANLLPLKLYNALFYNNFNGTTDEVLRYNFQTSQYATFSEQVQSYVLDPVNSVFAIFNIDKAFPAANITSAQQIVNGTESPTDILIQEFADEFDRLIDGALQLGAIDPPQTTDFNVITDTNTGNILGVLVRNPEPFNDPKLPPNVLSQTLTVLLNSFVNGFTIIFSKDRSKAFITNNGPNSLNMSTGSYLFTFQYILYNGTAYATVDTETVQFTIS